MSSIATPGGVVEREVQNNAMRRVARPRRPSTWATALVSCCALASCTASTELVEPPSEIDLTNATVEVTAGNDQEAVVGSTVAENLVVTVRASDGTPIAGAPVWWTFRQGQGKPRGSGQSATVTRVVTDASGQASVEWALGTRAGLQTATADLDAPSAALVAEGPSSAPKNDNRGRKREFRANAKPGKASEVLMSVDSLALEEGQSVSVTATVVDRYGNPIPDAVVEWRTSDPSVAIVGQPAPAPAPVIQATEE